jgi:hypothetical protein
MITRSYVSNTSSQRGSQAKAELPFYHPFTWNSGLISFLTKVKHRTKSFRGLLCAQIFRKKTLKSHSCCKYKSRRTKRQEYPNKNMATTKHFSNITDQTKSLICGVDWYDLIFEPSAQIEITQSLMIFALCLSLAYFKRLTARLITLDSDKHTKHCYGSPQLRSCISYNNCLALGTRIIVSCSKQTIVM